ncbi:WD40 repeat-like protein [Phanerochaete sordida]|uniref:WD40 repeat-like protein n=1 Tax=Phanerochaete sordida TaxID=48140 RepID=A0A9P3G3D7_9APHY|nr:WD40 repeat-like protein [Phanerochaete sordida]
MSGSQAATSDSPSSPEDGGNFRRSLQIDMKGLVGDAVGNMSISPGSRDVVLAARKGLFIIDLENPLNVPRFLPQGGTWDVADVQWNPHMSRKEYIVSTSSEKLLIWNLYISGKTSIEHILRSHYRAITDINWHLHDPDVVVSTGIDSWLWAWDLRTPQKPIIGLCAFNAAGTQVKWNRQDGNILASSHMNEVLVWDRRKGSLPVTTIKAHDAKIYGIDWAHDKRNELVTCSLDTTIKAWDISQSPTADELYEPSYTIHTSYPIWRARNLPFGKGVLSLPQRGETALEMWTPQDLSEPVERFEGHADVVKEFVWRKGGQDDSEFQLITWSKDRTLRFWPLDPDVMQARLQ